MPSKAHRAASRQAKLQQKRRRAKDPTYTFDAGPTTSQRTAQDPIPEAQLEQRPTPKSAPVAPPVSQAAQRSARSPSAAAPTRHDFLGAELRRIGTISIIIFAILAAASFALSM